MSRRYTEKRPPAAPVPVVRMSSVIGGGALLLLVVSCLLPWFYVLGRSYGGMWGEGRLIVPVSLLLGVLLALDRLHGPRAKLAVAAASGWGVLTAIWLLSVAYRLRGYKTFPIAPAVGLYLAILGAMGIAIAFSVIGHRMCSPLLRTSLIAVWIALNLILLEPASLSIYRQLENDFQSPVSTGH